MVKKKLQTIFSIYGFLVFVILLLILLPFFFIASLFGKVRGGNAIYAICSIWADLWFIFIGLRTKIIHEEKNTEQRPCIFVANHISYMDIPMIVKIIREPVRVLAKEEMAKIPVFGFVYRNAAVLVNRTDPEKRRQSVLILKKVLKKGISIFIFPEGTFNETGGPLKSFYDGAFRIALETQTPIQPIIFPDTVKRLHHKSVFSLSPGICRAVYLPMVDIHAFHDKGMAELKQHVFDQMAAAVEKYRDLI
jgi:1-acyl-sn-glycerol-3-phosphate acyltransferase